MSPFRPPYPGAFRQQMVNLADAGSSIQEWSAEF
jgi:hypothetical protein